MPKGSENSRIPTNLADLVGEDVVCRAADDPALEQAHVHLIDHAAECARRQHVHLGEHRAARIGPRDARELVDRGAARLVDVRHEQLRPGLGQPLGQLRPNSPRPHHGHGAALQVG